MPLFSFTLSHDARSVEACASTAGTLTAIVLAKLLAFSKVTDNTFRSLHSFMTCQCCSSIRLSACQRQILSCKSPDGGFLHMAMDGMSKDKTKLPRLNYANPKNPPEKLVSCDLDATFIYGHQGFCFLTLSLFLQTRSVFLPDLVTLRTFCSCQLAPPFFSSIRLSTQRTTPTKRAATFFTLFCSCRHTRRCRFNWTRPRPTRATSFFGSWPGWFTDVLWAR